MLTNEDDLAAGIVLHGLDVVEKTVLDPDQLGRYIEKLTEEKLNYPIPLLELDKKQWFMPNDYKKMDIEKYLKDICPNENYERLETEIQEYRKRNLLDLLKQIKYIVDTLENNNIVWGVGRGSSVASYVLFLLKIHRIDSVKYKLPLDEFFKGVEHG